MGLTRTSSGLKLRDEFGSDTSANYNSRSGTSFAIGSGYLALDYGAAVNTTQSGILCVTSKIYRYTANSVGPGLWASNDFSNDANIDGYTMNANATKWSLFRVTNYGFTELGSSANSPLGDNNWGYARIYRSGNDVVLRAGASALTSIAVSASDTNYTTGLYAGARANTLGTAPRADDLEGRTSHLVTCSGLSPGWYLKVSDGTTTAKAAESSGTATVDAGAVLFPLASVSVYDGDPDDAGSLVAECDTGDYADMGGGDVFAYSASGLWLPQLIKPQYFPQFGGLTYG